MRTLRVLLALALALGAWSARAELPPEDACPTLTGGAGDDGLEDVGPIAVREGMIVAYGDLFALRRLLPPELWRLRDTFFYEGMRLEVGPCYRRYAVPSFVREATRANAGRARIDDDGNLRDFVAGLPFPPDAIDSQADDAGVAWAWNLELRYRGAGPHGRFKLVDMPSRIGRPQTYLGSFFQVKTTHRADLAESGFKLGRGDDNLWVAGGQFTEPFDARHLAWRQFRPTSTLRRYKEADRTYVYVPTMRKPRRAATVWSDGLFTPRYTVSGDAAGGPVPIGTGGEYSVGAINPTGGESAASSEDIKRGFTGLALRPNAYHWKFVGEQSVLAPLNVRGTGYPHSEDRNWGPSGLSIASDVWDVRHAVVIEGIPKMDDRDFAWMTLYIDYQTQQPLYVVTRRPNRLVHEVGILAHRFSSRLVDYPLWPRSGEPAFVFDPVAAVFFSSNDGGTGWRRESFDVRSVPVSDAELRSMTSTTALIRGR
ncbi:MAG: DUF1329 domain-containing protein [Deltaproteobacteria bacterium]|nr:MAG: DUF1329 domain-containing protein [Deltaproteobacteria bacterium]